VNSTAANPTIDKIAAFRPLQSLVNRACKKAA